MSTSITELKNIISDLPRQFIAAIERRAEVDIKAERIEAQIAKLKVHLSLDQETIEEPLVDEVETTGVLQLEADLDRLKLSLDEAESRAELEFRSNNPKVTESHVQAAVCADPKVSELKQKHLDAKLAVKIKKTELHKERIVLRDERRALQNRHRLPMESDELDRLQNQLLDIEEDRTNAYATVESIRFTLETYQLLGALSSVKTD